MCCVQRPSLGVRCSEAVQMITVAVFNQKGGVGKTTLTLNLAVEVARRRGNWVCVVDTDPQRCLGDWWRLRKSEQPTLVECRLDQARQVAGVARQQGVTHLFFDTAPRAASSGLLPVVRDADVVLVPTRPSAMDLRAIGGTMQFLHEANAETVAVLNACPPRGLCGESGVARQARDALEDWGHEVAAVSIGQRTVFSSALADGWAVSECEPGSKASTEISRLWEWLIEGPLAMGEPAPAEQDPTANAA